MSAVKQLRPVQQNLSDAVQVAMNQFMQELMQSAMQEFMEIVKDNLQNQEHTDPETDKLKNKNLLTREEATSYLRVSIGHLDNIIKKGEISVTRFGRRVFIKRELLDQWINEKTGKGVAQRG